MKSAFRSTVLLFGFFFLTYTVAANHFVANDLKDKSYVEASTDILKNHAQSLFTGLPFLNLKSAAPIHGTLPRNSELLRLLSHDRFSTIHTDQAGQVFVPNSFFVTSFTNAP